MRARRTGLEAAIQTAIVPAVPATVNSQATAAIGVADRQWPEIDRVQKAEDRRVDADTQSQTQDGQKRESGRFAEQTQSQSDVVHSFVDTAQGGLFPQGCVPRSEAPGHL